jgi:hypothetical protein
LQRRRLDQRLRDFRLWFFADEWFSRIRVRARGFQYQVGEMQIVAIRGIGEPATPAFALDLAFQIGSDPQTARSDLVSSGWSLLLGSHDAEAGAPATILDFAC